MADPSRGIGTGTLRRPARRLAGIIARTALPRSLRSFHRPLRGYAGGLENSDASEVCLKRHLTGGDHARFISRFGCGCGTPLLALYMLVHVRFPSFALSNEDHGFTEDQRYETYLSLRRQTLRSMVCMYTSLPLFICISFSMPTLLLQHFPHCPRFGYLLSSIPYFPLQLSKHILFFGFMFFVLTEKLVKII